MKNITYLLVLLTFCLGIGCQKLDREINTSLSRDLIDISYPNKSREIAALYSGLPDGMLYIDGSAMMASATDEAEHTFERHSVQSFNNGSWNSNNQPDPVWARYFRQIRLCNQALVSFDKVDLNGSKNDPSASSQALYIAQLAELKRWGFEARFLRAYYYFELVKRYGGVPLLKESLSLETDFNAIQRNTLKECIDFIVAECDAAEPQLPPYAPLANYDAAAIGRRATKYAAMALKSRVLLYAASDLFNTPTWANGFSKPELISLNGVPRSQRWQAAADAAKRLIDTTAKYGVVLHNNYQQLFIANNFSRGENFLMTNPTANNTFERNNNPISFPGSSGLTTPTQNLVDAYEFKFGTGATATSVAFNWNNLAHVDNIYNFSTPTATSLTRDPRLRFNVTTNGIATTSPQIPYGVQFGTPAKFVQTYNGGLDGQPIANATKTGYYMRKYIQEGLDLGNNNTGIHNWVLFRLGEVYLNYAEALNEVSPGDARIAQYINLIRNRATVVMPPLQNGLNQLQMRQSIRNERRIELAFEDHRFWDLRRWMDEASLKTDIYGVNITGNSRATFVHTPFIVEKRVFDASKMYLYPIPFSEINVGKGIIQNPNW
ncbi:RagB/SusD family nutrient uptake outer membrane protein [Pedobacter petrophilus]|uniref:RagB/SusD family nutrient uptake outer membrane protein n=2 Tax=Pedobacter petrophilus TaxID=1908241 RepID=A0A7K0G2G8_9SPHI|nr:RagB/SusD family nutrient uptake outer membrane protein [Pedobacter petrophilus]